MLASSFPSNITNRASSHRSRDVLPGHSKLQGVSFGNCKRKLQAWLPHLPGRCKHDPPRAQAFQWLQDLVHSGGHNDAGNSNSLAARLSGGPKRDFLEARQVSLFNLFDGQEYQFDVPHYQRPYSWRTKQVFEMLQDFMASYHSRSEYFLGAIVTTRTGNGNAPLQVIDGQQRLTTLLIILAYVMDWAKSRGNSVLEQRMRRMIYLEADPLDAHSVGRYRLKLRSSDNAFFERNVLHRYLPTPYHLAGVPATAQAEETYAQATEFMPSPAPSAPNGVPTVPLENEAWWRIYENAAFVRSYLELQITREGLAPQDFAFHVLRSCHIVLMNARDEETSFRIFSTLNSRGMDLTMVDKLKADLLQVMQPSQREEYAHAWTELEDVLGRDTFHRVFDYMKDLASSSDPQADNLTVLEYFTTRFRQPNSICSVIEVALNYARIMLQLRQCRWEVSGWSSPRGGIGSMEPMLAENTETGGFTTVLDTGGPSSHMTTHGAIRGLERQSRHMNLLTEDGWLPPMLQFFLVVDDVRARTRFLQAAEALQLYLELCCDVGERAARWRRVSRILRSHDHGGNSEPPMREVMAAMVLTRKEREEFRAKLEMKDLFSLVDKRTIAHLLLRAEGGATSTNPSLDFSRLRVERIVPPAPPEGSMWRKNKLFGPAWVPHQQPSSPEPHAYRQGNAGGVQYQQHHHQQQHHQHLLQGNGAQAASVQGQQTGDGGWDGPGRAGNSSYSNSDSNTASSSRTSDSSSAGGCYYVGANGGGFQRGSAYAAAGGFAANGASSSSSSSSSISSSNGSAPTLEQRESRARRSRSRSGSGGRNGGVAVKQYGEGGRVGSLSLQQQQHQHQQQQRRASPTPDSGGHKYWFEVQRMFWHSKLGNLVLLPTASPLEVASADWDVKANFYRQCGVEALFPEFSGSVVQGRFAQQRFSFEECKARHAEIVQRLCEEFRLDAEEEDILDDSDSDEEESDYDSEEDE